MSVIRRKHLKPGMLVEVDNKGTTIRGNIRKVVPPNQTNQSIEVELTSGTTGVIKRIVTKNEIEKESFKFYNLFFHSRHLLTIWNKYTKETFTLKTKNKKTQKIEKAALLFSGDEQAQRVLRELNREELAVRRISRKKPIIDNFNTEEITHYRLNEQRRVNQKRLNQLEEQFNQF